MQKNIKTCTSVSNLLTNPAIKQFYFKFNSLERSLIGGPFTKAPSEFFTIKMAVEIPLPCDISIPTRDYSVPEVEVLDAGIRKSLITIARGKKPIFVGCAGGIGRTGLYLGCLVKLLGEKNPVQYVRGNYKSHAIETREQQLFVNGYAPSFKTKLMLGVAKAIAIAY